MKSFKEYAEISEALTQEELQKKRVYFDDPFTSNTKGANLLTKRGYKVIGGMHLKTQQSVNGIALALPNREDEKLLKGANIKSGEVVFRSATDNSASGGMASFTKVNIAKQLAYVMVQTDDEDVKFERKGIKIDWVRFDVSVAKKLGVV